MDGGVDTTTMSPRLHSDEAAPAPMSSGLHHSAAEVKYGGVPAPASRPQPNLRDGGLSPHCGGDRQGGDEFRSGGSGRGNPRHFPSRGRGRRGRNTRGGHRGFHLPAQDVELLGEPAALKEAAPAEVQQATLAVQKATPVQDVELAREPAALKEASPAEVQQATLAEVQKATPATMATPDGQCSFWCDICRVSCSSLVTLEGHKNGKRHQKTKLGLERFEDHQKLVAGVQEPKPQMALGEADIDARMSIPSLPKEANLSEELPKEATSEEVPPEKLIVETDNGSRGIKRKKPSEPVRVCTLCNAMCDTILTFKAHLGSKKHMGRVKRQKGPDMEYGCVPVPISSDQPAADAGTTAAADNIFFGLARRDMLLQQGNGYDGMVAEISPHQQAVESVQVKDELLKPQAKPEVECQEYEDPTARVGGI